jgi:hypothetical protein
MIFEVPATNRTRRCPRATAAHRGGI